VKAVSKDVAYLQELHESQTVGLSDVLSFVLSLSKGLSKGRPKAVSKPGLATSQCSSRLRREPSARESRLSSTKSQAEGSAERLRARERGFWLIAGPAILDWW